MAPCQSETAVRTFTCDCRYPLCLSDRSCLALIFGVACACFLDYYLPKKVASIFLAFIDLVAGIPSVIFGFIGLTVLVKAFATHLHMAAGQCILAAGIVLGIMLLPFVISTCHESLQTARKTYEFSATHLDSPENLPCAFYSSGNPARESLQVQ